MDSSVSLTRRRLLAGLGAASALTLLGGCEDLVDAVAGSCPSDPAQSGGISWIPDIGHPVFYGYQERQNMRIYYPTFATSVVDAPVLRVCGVRWPVVLFLHGQPPLGLPFQSWFRKWELFGEVLARSGYVVVAPSYHPNIPLNSYGAAVDEALAAVTYVRTQWPDSDWVDQRASSTAVAGHSYGALIGARVAAARPDFAAYVSLSGGFYELNDPDVAAQVGGQPSLFMWASDANFENLDTLNIWASLPQSKYAAVFKGQHFDYLPASETGNAVRGPCPHVGSLAADLVALFIASNLFSLTKVPVDLTRPKVQLTPAQEPFGGAHLTGEAAFRATNGCRADLRWKVGDVVGSRKID